MLPNVFSITFLLIYAPFFIAIWLFYNLCILIFWLNYFKFKKKLIRRIYCLRTYSFSFLIFLRRTKMCRLLIPTFFCIVCTIVHNAKGQNTGRLELLTARPHTLPLNPTLAASDGDQFVASTPVNQWFTQKLDHFNQSNTQTWQQVNFD